MAKHLPLMEEDLGLLLARASWGILRIPPQATQTTLTRMLSQVTQTIVLSRMPCQATQMLTKNHVRRKKVIQVKLHISCSTCISIQILPYCPICSFDKRTSSSFS